MEIAIGKNQVIWVKKQTAKNTPAWPAASDAVLITSDAKFTQDRSFYDDKQKRLTKGKTGRLAGLYKAGEFNLSTYIKPSGSLGVAPVPGKILESLFGVETVNASTSVVYTLDSIDSEPIYLSVLAKDNFQTWLLYDLVVANGTIMVKAADSEEGYVSIDASGGFLKSLFAGTDATSQLEAIAATAIHVVDARKFEVGQKIIVGTSGVTAGHEITAVDVSTNIVTIAASGLESEQASGVVVKGWTPAITEAGYLIHGQFGRYQEKIGAADYANVLITEAQVEISNGWHVLEREKNDDAYPTSFAAGERDVSFKINRYFKADGGVYRYEANNQTQKLIKLQAANTTYSASEGKRMEIGVTNLQIDSPVASGDAERSFEINGHVFETSALNDSISMTFA